MILRRLTNAIRRRDWFTVVIETLIVVLGVFLGLQVNNWNVVRGNRVAEANFMERLHPDIVRVEQSSERVRARRVSVVDDLRSATEVIFDVVERDRLTQAECMAIATSHYYNINVLSLPSVTELTNAGRLSIIRDPALRAALVDYEQRVEALLAYIEKDHALANNLLMLRPELVKVQPVFDAELGEMQTRPDCDLEAMREDRAFLNAVAENLDAYDAYLRDGLLPWDAQLAEIHRLIDTALEITHEAAQ
ncbi:hypothetical protein [Hyphomonas sp. UBA4494]|jgi:hypothetical protein|uniref:hypothetical protein n=1 Tax=Hyphomonas sp. UBA4494 TaxID=1946631 RepID=UPI0025BD2336|nr:hypothetical protein [Hyphomonas sp. UBA4494]